MVRSSFANQFVIARHVVEIFFPQRPDLGLEQSKYSPTVIDKIVSANAEHKSATKARKMLFKLAGMSVTEPIIHKLTGVIGAELQKDMQQQASANLEQQLDPQYAEAPQVAVVSVDGGRIMTRGKAGRGIHDQQWKETKVSCLLTMSSSPSDEDPHPELPGCFANEKYVERLVRELHTVRAGSQESLENLEDLPEIEEILDQVLDSENLSAQKREKPTWRPKRLMRTCVSSMVSSDKFGPLVAGEAQRRGFYDAQHQAFLGDGLGWNWTLHRTHFCDFVAIVDFVHPLSYIYNAAQVIAPDSSWSFYLQATTDCWQGRVADVLKRLRAWQATHPVSPDETLPDHDPREIVRTAVTYLTNNEKRMDYPAYRKEGLPVSTSMVESLIKEINYRVKGTEKFWNRPEGAEAILQVRTAALRDDDRLSQWILNRPGSYHYRRKTAVAESLAAAS
jgi:hypothetical protein